MNRSHTRSGSSTTTERAGTKDLQGGGLLLARMVWIIVVVPALGLFVASIPGYFTYLHSLSATPITDVGAQLGNQDVQQLHAAGLSIDFYAWYSLILNCIFVIVYSLIGLALFLRKSENRMALFASFTLVMFSLSQNSNMLQTLPSAWNVAIMGINFLGSLSLTFFFLLFPSGRFERRWIRWLAVVQVVYWTVNAFVLSSTTSIVAVINFIFFLALAGSEGVVQIYRYRRLSSTIERQQTRWVVFGTTVGLGGYLIGIIVVFGILRLVFDINVVLFIIGYTLLDGLLLLFPISIGIAIMRSHLWDIDILIHRTLVYGTLTVLLALVYFGLVIGLGALVRLFTGQLSQSPIVVVASTLAIAALSQPFRNRIQTIIDRRFYRRKYDAAKTLEAFSATLRNEVDLNTLREHLLAVVEETMQPAHVSLWLRTPQPTTKQQGVNSELLKVKDEELER